jgi:hypothetical protein
MIQSSGLIPSIFLALCRRLLPLHKPGADNSGDH